MLVDCNAYDLILIQQSGGDNKNAPPSCSEAMISFFDANDVSNSTPITLSLLVVDENGQDHRFPVVNNTIQDVSSGSDGSAPCDKHSAAALTQIASLLQPGRNSARILLVRNDDDDVDEEHIIGIAPMNIFLWSPNDKVVVVDVDGTITKSTMRGFLYTAIYEDYSDVHCHDGVCEFLASIPNVRFVYLTNRPIGYANTTRNFLTELCQPEDDGEDSDERQYRLPAAPLIGFTGGLAGVFKMDLYDRNAHEFKYDTLQKYVARPFQDQGILPKNVFYAGFGNTLYDMHAYHKAGMDLRRMFLIDKQSKIHCLDDDKVTVQELLSHPKEYAFTRGTLFDGYRDERLLSHVLGYSKI